MFKWLKRFEEKIRLEQQELCKETRDAMVQAPKPVEKPKYKTEYFQASEPMEYSDIELRYHDKVVKFEYEYVDVQSHGFIVTCVKNCFKHDRHGNQDIFVYGSFNLPLTYYDRWSLGESYPEKNVTSIVLHSSGYSLTHTPKTIERKYVGTREVLVTE